MRLTASSFTAAVQRKAKFEKVVEISLYNPTISAMEWGRNYEEAGRTAYIGFKTKDNTLPSSLHGHTY